MNAGLAQIVYYIGLGPARVSGQGALGAIAELAIGQGYAYTATIAVQTGTPITATDWSQDNWGEILLACPKGGPIFYWPPNKGNTTALPVGTGPAQNTYIFVSMPNQILVACGSAKSMVAGSWDTSIDKLLVRWSTQNDFTNWMVSFTTLAGSFHLGTGSKIVGACQAANNAFVLTDVDAYSMSYLGYPLVFGFNQIGTECGLVGPHAIVSLHGVVYWMSYANFFTTSGQQSVRSVPCPVWDTVFQNIDINNISKAVAAANGDFNEVTFYYASVGGTGENDSYVKVNVVENVWDYGRLPRSAWEPRSVLGPPIAADPTTFYLQQHETGYSADGALMDSYFETGYFAIGDGENFSVIDQLEPDMKWQTVSASTPNASVAVTITAVDYPSGGNAMTNVLTMTNTTKYLTPRVRGKQIKFRVETNDTTSWWRAGRIRYRWGLAGRR